MMLPNSAVVAVAGRRLTMLATGDDRASAGSSRSRSATKRMALRRSSGSSMSTGTVNRSGANRLAGAGASPPGRYIGMDRRSMPTSS